MKTGAFIGLVLMVLLTSCGDEMDFLPKTKFHGEMAFKPMDPSKLFSEEFSVRETQYESQDQKYKVVYKKDKNFTTILNKLEGDTLFQGFCYRDQGIWYFKYQLTDSTFWLSAIKKEKNRLNGWPISWGQMYVVDSIIKSENLILDTLSSKFTLDPNKKNLRKIYGDLFSQSSSSRYELIKQKGKVYDPGRRAVNGGKNVISNITPNMDEGYIDISFKSFSDYTVDLFLKDGPLAIEEKIENQNFIHLDISDLDEGFYLMEINESSSGKLLVRSEIYIEK